MSKRPSTLANIQSGARKSSSAWSNDMTIPSSVASAQPAETSEDVMTIDLANPKTKKLLPDQAILISIKGFFANGYSCFLRAERRMPTIIEERESEEEEPTEEQKVEVNYTMAPCSTCKQDKPTPSFLKPNGKGIFKTCTECRIKVNEKDKERRARNLAQQQIIEQQILQTAANGAGLIVQKKAEKKQEIVYDEKYLKEFTKKRKADELIQNEYKANLYLARIKKAKEEAVEQQQQQSQLEDITDSDVNLLPLEDADATQSDENNNDSPKNEE